MAPVLFVSEQPPLTIKVKPVSNIVRFRYFDKPVSLIIACCNYRRNLNPLHQIFANNWDNLVTVGLITNRRDLSFLDRMCTAKKLSFIPSLLEHKVSSFLSLSHSGQMKTRPRLIYSSEEGLFQNITETFQQQPNTVMWWLARSLLITIAYHAPRVENAKNTNYNATDDCSPGADPEN